MKSVPGSVALKGVKIVFFAASAIYIAHVVTEIAGTTVIRLLSPSLVCTTLAASIAFASTTIFHAAAWRILLRHLGFERRLSQVSATVFTTQIGKYIPGNVGHHIGRTLVAKTQMGIPTPTTITSILQESALVCLATLVVATTSITPLTATLAGPANPTLDPDTIKMGVAAALVSAIILVTIASIWRRANARPQNVLLRWIHEAMPDWRLTASTIPHYIAINVLNGVAIALIFAAVSDPSPADAFSLMGIYALAWILGFLIPGPPGGLGVRDAALMALLGTICVPEVALVVTAVARVATLVADGIIFATGVVLSRRNRGKPKNAE